MHKPLINAALLGVLTACGSPSSPPSKAESSADLPATASAAQVQPAHQAFFGDLHIHSRWSFDAYSLNTPTGPRDAYAFARGEEIEHVSGQRIQLRGAPLDFMALTEHAAYMGVSATVTGGDASEIEQHPLIADLSNPDPAISGAALGRFADSVTTGKTIDGLPLEDLMAGTWKRLVALADEYYEPGEFTTFVGFEWTAMPGGQNLHRNLIFRGNKVPSHPISSLDTLNPEDLWDWMDQARAQGDDLIAIPHNANASNGLMYGLTTTAGAAMTSAYAEQRLRNEPVSELYQIKGTSEAHPLLSDEDNWANFELFDRVLGHMLVASKPQGSYVRQALKDGLQMQAREQFNPYQMGVVGSTDGHNSAMPFEEYNYFGKIGIADHTPERRLLEQLSPNLPLDAVSRWGAAGLAGVWAKENTREALFDAIRAKRTFATSGPRIRAALFADVSGLTGENLTEQGFAKSIPMGSTMTDQQLDGKAPVLTFTALKDPAEAPLERAQIIKGWFDGERSHEQIVDVACAHGNIANNRCAGLEVQGADENCAVNPQDGANELTGSWQDPNFNPNQHAFYYLRVLQVPTCRWSTFQSMELEQPLPEHLPRTLQERAATSAIWYLPE